MADQSLYYAKLTYNANGTGVSGVPGASTYGTSTSGGSVTGYVSTARPTRTYFTFNGWALSSSASSGMSGGAALSLTAATSKGTGNARNYNLYATWQHVNVTCTFNANGGSGAPSPVTHWGGYAMDIPDTIPTRSGYTFLGWAKESTATSALYTAGQKEVALYGNITLYAVWTPANSAIASVTSSVPMDGSTQGTLTITRYNSSYVHSVTIALSSSLKQEFTNVGTSLSFTLPASWIAGVPNATSATVTVTVRTMNGSAQIGNAATATLTATVPASIVPSISSVTESFVNDNATVNGWGILLQGYSKIQLTATATAGSGASISSYEFSGLGLSYTGTSNEATSNVLSESGSKTWTVRVTDSRGRTATQTVTFTVYEYVTPSISSFAAERSDSTGQRDDVNGDYLHSKMIYAFSSANGNNSVTAEISYKAHSASSWTVGQSAVVSDTWYTFGGGNIDIDKNFDVRATLTDAIGQTVTYIVEVQSVVGYSFGLKNDRVRFGGVVQKPGFQNDLDLEQNGDAVFNGGFALGSTTLSESALQKLLTTNITDAITFGAAWTPTTVTATVSGGRVDIMFVANAAIYIANYEYTVATIASDYAPMSLEVCTGHTTDANYNPQGLVTVKAYANGNIGVIAQNTSGNYFVVHLSYAI